MYDSSRIASLELGLVLFEIAFSMCMCWYDWGSFCSIEPHEPKSHPLICTTLFASPLCLSPCLCCCPLYTTQLAYRYSPYPCQGLVERHFHVKLGSLQSLANFGYVSSGLFGGICDSSLYSPCHSRAFRLSKKRKRNDWKRRKLRKMLI